MPPPHTQKCISERLKDFLRANYSDRIPNPLVALMPDETNLFKQQEFLLNSNQGAPAQDLVSRFVGYAVANDHW